jgi:hypothetical protein
MRHVRDHVQVRWYPPGSYVVEQGEPGAELFLILSGEAEVWQESNNGRREKLRQLDAGEFFGELGIASRQRRSADVIASTSLTCLVLSPAEPTKFAGRGEGARMGAALPGTEANPPLTAGTVQDCQDMISCDVSKQVMRKVEALSAYRSQLPLEPGMFPDFLLQEMFGSEHFVAVSTGRAAHPDEAPPVSVREADRSAPPTAR